MELQDLPLTVQHLEKNAVVYFSYEKYIIASAKLLENLVPLYLQGLRGVRILNNSLKYSKRHVVPTAP